ncbi:MAG: HAMP domain-containing histidine kinase [Oscillospiraceae bacterium]|nr:HAMP domain-containing histidine kinase [Oscillospiraceae bacterium]MCL2279123.1 HAMP domain-containing histidine kinase [Oscillospiraceae bacterium]
MIFGLIMTVVCALLCVGFYLYHRAQNKKIAKLSEQIQMILHGYGGYDLHVFKEGKFYILQSEIQKMTMRIREQRDALIKDKQYLADSLADIAHQLRTPLTSANLVLSFLPDSDEVQRVEYVREVETLLMRMDWLITALLKISRLDAGVVEFADEQINMGTLIKSALAPLAIAFELHGIDVSVDVEGVTINGDAGWLSEAIENILKNCMESVKHSGEITVTCNETALFAELVIHDSGKGFDETDLPHLFDRFYKSTKSTGYGIGLALAKMIVVRHNASITAKNHPTGGALFILRFPKVTK